MYKLLVAALQRPGFAIFRTVRSGLFAYNEVPTIAVATDCWFRARLPSTRPFFLPGLGPGLFLNVIPVDETHPKFLQQGAHRPR